jgi:D-alanyl-lipoteichoic acid acyltransferase DltB (MBOAT superfamily)
MVILTVLLLIGVYFAFSGFSDMGRGISMMLGIPLKPDFGNCLFAITPTDYFKNFIKSLWLWMKDYLREPIESRWGKKWRGGRIASTAVVCISIMLWYRANLQMLILMIPIILFIVLDRVFSLKKKLAANVAFRILSSLLTLMCIGMFWILIKSQNVYLLINAISGYNPAPSLQSYNMYMTVFSREIVAVCALIFFIMLPKIISSVKKTASKRGMAIFSWCWTSTLVVIFIITVLLVMPQYPELATTAFSGIML